MQSPAVSRYTTQRIVSVRAAVSALLALNVGLAYAAEQDTLENVVVTGSRLRRDASLDAPVPTVTVDANAIANSGSTSLGDLLFGLPQGFINSSSQSNSGTLFNAGQSRVDLRGLGSGRTLVLVDGRRHITGDFRSPAVDLNSLPSALIERVEVITGGGSAVYGSEAISGVVNITLRNHLDGLIVDAKGGTTEQADGNEWQLSAAYGAPFSGDRGHFVVGGEWAKVGAIDLVDRGWAYPGIRRDNSAGVVPQTVIAASRSNAIPTATFQLVGGNNATTARSVSIAPNYSAINTNSSTCRTATVQAYCQDPWLFYSAAYTALQAPSDREVARAYVDYRIADSITTFGEISYAQANGVAIASPAFSVAAGGGTMPVRLFGNNAYLNGPSPLAQQLRTAWTGAGLTLARGSTAQVGKFWEELGRRDIDVSRETTTATIGVNGDSALWAHTINWQSYVQYSELDGRTVSYNVPNITRVQQATDAVIVGGQIVCNDAAARAAGCVPWDLINGPATAAIDWVNANGYFDGIATQTIVAGSAETALFNLPAGDVRAAVGAEYREEKSDFRQDELSATGALFLNAIGRTQGQYHASEAYIETGVPLLRDVPFAYRWNIEAAGRSADYSNVGHVNQWQLQSTWAPVHDVSFRASQSKAVRAPNITEAFGPRSRNFTTAALDPCDSAEVAKQAVNPQLQATRIANCAAAINSANFTYNPATFISNIGPGRPSLALLQGGNPNVFEETADTMTVGVVLQPRWVESLSVSLDYWRIIVDDAISTIPVNTLLSNLCYDASQTPANNRFCQFIRRDITTGGITQVELTSTNVQKIETSGIDLSIHYEHQFGSPGTLRARVDAAKVKYWDLTGFAGGPTTHFAGVIGTPEYKATVTLGWSVHRWQVDWQTRFQDSYAVSEVDPPSARDPFYTGNYYEHDIVGQYRINDDLKVRLGIVNATNETPPSVPEAGSATGSTSSSFDNRGRWYYLGVTYTMGHAR